MRSKPLIILAVLLVILIGLKLVQNALHRSEVEQTGLELLLADLPLTEIGRVVLAGPDGDGVELVRRGDDWIVESSFGHPADASRVEQLTGELDGLQGEFRSEDSSVLAGYGLDDAQAVHLRIFGLDGSERGHLLLGNRAPSGSGYFLRRDGDQKAFAAQGNLLGAIGIWGENRVPEGKRFLNLKVLELDRDQVDGFALLAEGERLMLAKAFADPPADSLPVDRSQYTWLMDGVPADRAATDGVQGALAGVWARDLLDPAGDYAFAETARIVEIALASGERKTIEFGAAVTEPEEGVAMRLAGESHVYLVYDNLPDRIFKSRADLAPKEE